MSTLNAGELPRIGLPSAAILGRFPRTNTRNSHLDREIRSALASVYGSSDEVIKGQELRYSKLCEQFNHNFLCGPTDFFSSPGRLELSGNHTDHNGGRVLTASVNFDFAAAAAATDDGLISIFSEGIETPLEVDTHDLERKDCEHLTTRLIKGILAGFKERGFNTGGFNACITSDVPQGSGLSSSAALEMLLGKMLNDFHNAGKLDLVDVAKCGQYAENKYWDKNSGLLDQLGCSLGGINMIDFSDKENPGISGCDFDLKGYSLVIVNTAVDPLSGTSRGDHSDLSAQYSAIPAEMWAVAAAFGKKRLCEVDAAAFSKRYHDPAITTYCGVTGRGMLRARHFFDETERPSCQAGLLSKGKIREFLQSINESGLSSALQLQNITPEGDTSQNIAQALDETKRFFRSHSIAGACRVHGGGFAGVILAILPGKYVQAYKKEMERGAGVVMPVQIRSAGTVNLVRDSAK